MKKWKFLTAGFLLFCLTSVASSYTMISADEEQEAEAPVSYAIETNEIPGWPQGPATESATAALMDVDTGTFLYSKGATEKMYPASITKIMTALLVVENCDLDDEITFSEIVYDLEEGSSHLGIQPGEKMRLEDAVYGLMLASANDIANGLAEYMGGSISGFADLMNARAQELGCVNTHFANPHGLYQDDHYTCAHDMALIAAAAYQDPIFRKIVTTHEYTIPETNLTEEERSFLNHQKMMHEDEEYYRDWCTGGKTGYTSQCLNTLVTYGEKDGKTLVSVVFRAEGSDVAYWDSIALMEYGFDEFSPVNLEKDGSDDRFCDIMGLRYFGKASRLQSPVWDRSPIPYMSGWLMLPDTADIADVTCEVANRSGSWTTLSCKYNGWPVGTFVGNVQTIFAPAQMVFEKDVEVVTAVQPETSGDHIQIESLDEVLTQTATIFETGYHRVMEYTQSHFLSVLIGGTIALAVLVVLIIVLIFRCTSESRIRRRRRQEEQERRKREEEIDKMTTAEIEAELRAVMEQERLKKEQEELARAEAERAAEEARIMEEKAHETERLIDELEKERQERLAAKNKGNV